MAKDSDKIAGFNTTHVLPDKGYQFKVWYFRLRSLCLSKDCDQSGLRKRGASDVAGIFGKRMDN